MGRLDDAIDVLGGPVLYGAAAWAYACRLTFLMRWLKANDDFTAEADPIG